MKTQGVGKGKKFKATVLPINGNPYPVDVETDEKGCVEVDGKMWFIVPGSTWTEGSKRHVILPESMAESLNSYNLMGKTVLGARNFFLFMKMNLLEQLFRMQNVKPWYGRADVWIITGAIGLLILVGYLAMSQVTGAIHDLQDAIRDLSFPAGDRQGHQELQERS